MWYKVRYKEKRWFAIKAKFQQAYGKLFERGIQMKLVRVRFLASAGLAAAVFLLLSAPSYANCGAPQSVTSGDLTGQTMYLSCGKQAIGQMWAHRNALWNKTNGSTAGVTDGQDQGAGPNNAVPEVAGDPNNVNYSFIGNWQNAGTDGCIQNVNEGSNAPCTGGTDLPPTNWVIAGRDPANPTQVRAMFGSVDLNSLGQAWFCDNAGAASAGDHCGADPLNTGAQVTCGTVPSPAITSFAPPAGGHVIYQVNFPVQSVPYVDDCAIAESSGVNCPRNLNAGRVLMVRRGPCFGGTPVNNLAVNYTEAGTGSSRAELWHPYNAGDANYDGFPDATPTTPNAIALVPATNTTQPVDITLLASATPGLDDCLYLGTAAAADASPLAGFTPWLAPYVAMERHSAIPLCQFVCPNGSCATAAGQPCPQGGTSASNTGATPAPDKVLGLVATKTGSNKINVAWSTSGEETVSKLTLVGNRTNGTVDIRNVELKGGGLGGNYSVDLTSGDLKGAKKVSVIVTYNNGSKASFGPVAVE
jgi:hypothetical protein